ncbi:MAG: hypothetical protein ABIJ21_06125 [Nanoarchaeota archaeon]
MNDEEKQLQFVMDWFPVRPRLSRIIKSIVRGRLERLEISSFDEIYESVGLLVEEFDDKSYHLRSLNAPYSPDDSRTPIEVTPFREQTRESRSLLSDLTRRLDGRISSDAMNVLSQLERSDIFCVVFGVPVDIDVSLIESRLEEIAVLLAPNGYVPERPIKSVSFSPLKITFRRRSYDGNPYRIVEENPEKYGNLRRWELGKFDPALYEALHNHDQIHLIPRERRFFGNLLTFLRAKYGDLTRGQIALRDPPFYNALRKSGKIEWVGYKHRRFNGNPKAYFNEKLSELSVKRRSDLMKKDRSLLEAMRRSGQLDEVLPADPKRHAAGKKSGTIRNSPKKIEEIISAFETYQGNSREASTNLSVSPSTIRRYWREAGLYTPNKLPSSRSHGLSPSQVKMVTDSHATYQGNATEASNHLPFSRWTIGKYWKEEGLEHIVKGNPTSQDERTRIISAYDEYDGNLSAATRELPYTRTIIRRIWEEEHLQAKGKESGPILNDREKQEILDAYDLYDGHPSLAASGLNRSFRTVRKMWDAAGLQVNNDYSAQRLPEEGIEVICEAHTTFNGNASEVARNIPYNRATISKYWRENGLVSKGKRTRKKIM